MPETKDNHHRHHKDRDDDQAVYRLTARMGTWRYMAPEVARGEHYNLKCDVYSTALVFWEMLVGQKPYATLPNASDELKKNVGTPPPLDLIIDAKWQDILQAAWHVDVAKRSNMLQVHKALLRLQDDMKHQSKQQQQSSTLRFLSSASGAAAATSSSSSSWW